jgi:hypothetical protein
MTAEPRVVIQPPQASRRDREEISTLFSERLKMIDGCGVVGRIVTGVNTVGTLREVPPTPSFKINEAAITFTNHDHC